MACLQRKKINLVRLLYGLCVCTVCVYVRSVCLYGLCVCTSLHFDFQSLDYIYFTKLGMCVMPLEASPASHKYGDGVNS